METINLGKYELSLPSFMSTLPQSTIEDMNHNVVRIISCGIDPQDCGLYMVTSELEVKRIVPNGSLRPARAFPSQDGDLVCIIFQNDDDVVHRIESRLILLVAENCLNKSSLYVNDTYMCDVESGTHVVLRDDNAKRNEPVEEIDS